MKLIPIRRSERERRARRDTHIGVAVELRHVHGHVGAGHLRKPHGADTAAAFSDLQGRRLHNEILFGDRRREPLDDPAAIRLRVVERAVGAGRNIDLLAVARDESVHAHRHIVRVERRALHAAAVHVAEEKIPEVRRRKRRAVVETSAGDRAAEIRRRRGAAAARGVRPALHHRELHVAHAARDIKAAVETRVRHAGHRDLCARAKRMKTERGEGDHIARAHRSGGGEAGRGHAIRAVCDDRREIARGLIVFVVIPAEMRAARDRENLLITGAAVRHGVAVQTAPDHVEPQLSRAGLKGERERIAAAARPDAVARRGRGRGERAVVEWVVIHRRAGEAIGAAHFRREHREVRIHAGVVAVVAHGPVELAIRADAHAAAVVIIPERGQPRDDRRFAPTDARRVGVADDLLLAGRDGDEKINVVIRQKIRIEAEPDDAAFAVRINREDRRERRGHERAEAGHGIELHDAHLARFARDEKPPGTVRRPRDSGR